MSASYLNFPTKESVALAIETTLPYSTAAQSGWDEIEPGRRKLILAAAQAALEVIYNDRSEPAVFTQAHVQALYLGLGRIRPASNWVELTSDGRGSYRIGILTEWPKWDPVRGDPERPGTRARQIKEEERHMTIDEIAASILG